MWIDNDNPHSQATNETFIQQLYTSMLSFVIQVKGKHSPTMKNSGPLISMQCPIKHFENATMNVSSTPARSSQGTCQPDQDQSC